MGACRSRERWRASDQSVVRLVARLFYFTLPLALIACDGSTESGSDRLDSISSVLLANTTAEQEKYLVDGHVTAAEYESAMLANAQCMSDAGFPVVVIHDGIRIRYQGEGSEDLADVRAWGAQSRACADQHSDDVEALWLAQNSPSEEEVAQGRRRVVACLREHGIEVPDYETVGQMRVEGLLTEDEILRFVVCRNREMGDGSLSAFEGE